jgi:Protein of unknown function (DUF998)
MKLSHRLVVAGVFLAFGLQGHHAQARGPSTPKERAKVIELTRMLERDPLYENADATREWLREWTIEVPEIRFYVCNELLSPGLGENYPYSREIKLQMILSGAVFTLEHQDKAKDNVGAYIAGVEGSLRMYEVLVKSRPDARSAFLDGLVAMRDRGELADHVAKLAAEKCPKSNILLIAAPIGAAVGLILGSLIGWLFGGHRGHRSSAPDVASAENRSAKFASAAQWIVVACAAYYVIVGAVLHFLEPEYDPRYRFMSEYAWSAHGWLMTTTFFVLALALLTVALALRNLYGPSWSARVGFGLLVVGAAGICVAGVFRGFPLHDVGGAVGLPSVVIAALILSWSFRRAPGWRPLFLITVIALGMFTALLSIVIDVGMPGLQQRIFLFLTLLWLSVVVHRLVRITGAT